MKVLVFDTETTGLPIGRNPSIMDVEKWPYVVQLSFILYDTVTKQVVLSKDYIINIPITVDITPESVAIHHIDREKCLAQGINMRTALGYFNSALLKADVVVGHNISFDKRMVMVESIRLRLAQKFTINGVKKPEYCTMKNNINLCQINVTAKNGNTYYKYPTLSELHFKLFEQVPNGAHDALIDVLICLRCYLKIKENYDFVADPETPTQGHKVLKHFISNAL